MNKALLCHPEPKAKDLSKQREILRCTQNDRLWIASSLPLLAMTLLSACNLAPELLRSKIDTPASFKENAIDESQPITEGKWAATDPAMADAFGKGEWWRVFGDATLDALIAEAHKESPTLEAARARLEKARANTGVAESNLYPDLTLGAGGKRSRSPNTNPNFGAASAKPFTVYNTGLLFDYGLDVFGRARNTAKAAQAREAAQESVFKAARINLEADVAETYFALRALIHEEALLKRTHALREESLSITRKRLSLGDVSDLEVARSESELATTKADLLSVEQQRVVAENTLSILTGKPPESLKSRVCGEQSALQCIMPSAPPVIPGGVPSHLLERRPDIASAAQEMAAANAGIGLARGAFFPSIDISASGGYESGELSDLFNWSSRSWLLGPISGTVLSLPVFDGGRNAANLALSKASFKEAVATYRATVLSAFKETEDALAGIRTVSGRNVATADAEAAALRAQRIARLQYENGYISHLDHMDAERNALAASRANVQTRAQHYIATVTLIRALGGGWELPQDPTPAPAATASKAKTADLSITKPASTLKPKGEWQELKDVPAPAAKPAPKSAPAPFRTQGDKSRLPLKL